MNPTEAVGRNLAALRERKGLSQQEVAEYLGIARPQISYYENGQRPIPLPLLERLADLFAVEVADLTSPQSMVQEAPAVYAFRKEGLVAEDLQRIGNFQQIVRNYLKMIRIKNEKE